MPDVPKPLESNPSGPGPVADGAKATAHNHGGVDASRGQVVPFQPMGLRESDAGDPAPNRQDPNGQQSNGQEDAALLFRTVLERFGPRVSGFVLHGFFEPLVALSLTNDTLTLAAPSVFHRDWIRDHYAAEIAAELGAIANLPLHVVVEHVPGLAPSNASEDAVDAHPLNDVTTGATSPNTSSNAASGASPNAASGAPSHAPEPKRPAAVVPFPKRANTGPAGAPNRRLNPNYTFDRFITGESNRMAFAACRAVADAPAQTYSPLFLFGGVGLGKTHLLHAIGHSAAAANPGMRVVYMSAEEWVNEYIYDIRNQRFDQFRKRYRSSCDLLLIDDIQFLAGKDASQDEFFHTFNALHERGRQIVVTSDRYPHQIEGLEERLQTRLGWGLIADVQPPELETRVAILMHKADALSISLDDETAHYLATRIISSVRELEGALVRLKAFSTVTREPITLAFAQTQLGPILAGQRSGLTLERIVATVASYYDLRPAQVMGKGRQRQLSRARQIAMYVARTHLNMSLPELGRAFGRDHTTVLSSVRKIESLGERDAGMAAVLSRLESSLL